ncbi:YopX family protein [Mammaliicoccus sciuri]|uniref:YopX family protein n=1 Tax=Mammaliicoccus sciuri TaxID=1296 RepID=UPI0034DD9100
MIINVRAWDKVNKEMIEDIISIHFKAEMIVRKNFCFYPFKDIELMQSSGLTDYHYREYCEGDIARDVTSEEIGVIEYVEGAFVMRFACGDSVDLSDVKDEFEIIGNKFEDGYLLEEG